MRRGKDAWQYLYTLLGFALTIEGTVVSMIVELRCTSARLLVFGAGAAFTIWAFLDWGWFQNKLFGLKARYEDKFR